MVGSVRVGIATADAAKEEEEDAAPPPLPPPPPAPPPAPPASGSSTKVKRRLSIAGEVVVAKQEMAKGRHAGKQRASKTGGGAAVNQSVARERARERAESWAREREN
jgi:hypothetical protein